MSAIRVFDIRKEYDPNYELDDEKLVKGKPVLRDVSKIDTLCLHQTACTFGVTASMIKAAGGDAQLAQFMRAKRVHCHVTAFDEGAFVAAYPLRTYVYHGNGANDESIGLEIEGLFNGKPGGTPGYPRSEPSELVIEAAKAACTWIVEQAKLEGITLKYVVAHRQYADSRAGDPGWALWQRVAVEHCEKVLGLQVRLELTDRDGRPIPGVWDSRSKAKY
jgi:hypothetical protein